MADLMSLFQSGNPFLIDEAYKQLGQNTQQGAANVAATQANTNKVNTMLPYDVQHSQALTKSALEQARTQQIKSDEVEGVPLADRVNAHWNEIRGKSSDADLKRLGNQMEAMRTYALKPSFSLEDQTAMRQNYPGLLEQISTPQGKKLALQAYDDYVKHSLKYQTAKLASDASMYRTDNPPPRGTGSGGGKYVPGADLGADLAKMKRASEKVAHLETKLPFMSPEERATWTPILTTLKQQADTERADPNVGKFNIDPATGKLIRTPAAKLSAPQAPAWTPPNGWK